MTFQRSLKGFRWFHGAHIAYSRDFTSFRRFQGIPEGFKDSRFLRVLVDMSVSRSSTGLRSSSGVLQAVSLGAMGLLGISGDPRELHRRFRGFSRRFQRLYSLFHAPENIFNLLKQIWKLSVLLPHLNASKRPPQPSCNVFAHFHYIQPVHGIKWGSSVDFFYVLMFVYSI